MSKQISPQAIVHPSAKIGEGTIIHPFAIIEEGVEIGEFCDIRSFATLQKGTTMGSYNKVYEHATLGATSQNLRESSEVAFLKIGDRNIFRENVVVARGGIEGSTTIIGNDNFIQAGAHICHQVAIKNHVMIGLKSVVAGHCHIDDHAILSTLTSIFGRVHIGKYSIVRGGCRVKKHVPPYITTTTNPTTFYSINVAILKHHQFTPKDIRHLAHAYEIVYHTRVSLKDTIARIQVEVPMDAQIEEVLHFLKKADESTLGII